MQTMSLAQQQDLLRRQRRGYELIEQKRRQWLAELDYEHNLPILDGLLSMAYEHRQPQPTSGLVELQRLLLRMEERRLEEHY